MAMRTGQTIFAFDVRGEDERRTGLGAGVFLGLMLLGLSAVADPNPPTALLATNASPVQVRLTWTDNSSDETGFKVERSTDGTNYAQIAQLLSNTTVYRDRGVWPGRSYYYRVRAFNAGGDSAYCDPTNIAMPNLGSANVFGWGYSTPPAGLTGIVAVASADHGLALRVDGTVTGWGANSYGEATPPAGLTGVAAVAVYPYLSLALKSEGTVVGWGYNGSGEATPPAGLAGVAIAAGGAYGLALKNDGTVTGWGYNGYGAALPPAGLAGVVAISAGDYHALALKSDGTVAAWGSGSYGATTVPPGLNNVVAIAAGEFHSVALRSDGMVVAWGYDSYGQADVPAGLTNVVDVGAGSLFSAALRGDGTTVAWGIAGPNTPPEGLTGAWFLSAGFRQCLVISGAPFSPSSLIASAPASNRVDLVWTDNAYDEDGFKIERAPDAGGAPGGWSQVATVQSNMTAYSDGSVLPSTKYWFRVRAYNSGGNSPYGNQVSLATPPLAAPTSLKATTASATQINLTWVDNSPAEDGFKVERAPDAGGAPGTWAEVATVGPNVTAWTNTGLTELTRYWFRVHAYNSTADSPLSNQTNAMTQLGAPSAFAASAISANQVILSWTDNSALEDGFVIDRANSPFDQSWAPIATNAANATAFTYTTPSCSKTYYYRVHAFRGTTNSMYANVISNNTASVDTDGDGIPDCWMLTYFHHPTGQAADQSRATDDADHDGASNLQEYLAGTNPTNAASVLRITSLSFASNGARLSWTTVGGKKYALQTNSALSGSFSDLSPVIVMPGTNEAATNFLDLTGVNSVPARFYRVRVAP